MLIVSLVLSVLVMFLSSCSSDLPVQRETRQAAESVLTTQYSIVFVIHGDGDYLFHDNIGNEHEADEEAVASAIMVAKQNPHAEVFIFHQRPSRHFLFFFPLRDGEFYYYRNGKLISNELYWRDQKQSDLEPEAAIYHRFSVENRRKMIRVFIYCGHEIPEFDGAGYDASYPDRKFTINNFVNGLKGFKPDSVKFDLMILSTCYGGTPYTIGALGSISHFIIASPDNLHLSYFDLRSLERLDLSLGKGDLQAFAKKFAELSFERLIKNVQTAVSVAVYNADRIQKFLHSVRKVYDNTLNNLKGQKQAVLATMEHCDCADLPAYSLPNMNEGVEIFYRQARFGKSNRKQIHSGWECWKEEGDSMQPPYNTKPVPK